MSLPWQRYENNKMAAMRYYTMVTLLQQQDGGYVLPWKRCDVTHCRLSTRRSDQLRIAGCLLAVRISKKIVSVVGERYYYLALRWKNIKIQI